MKKITGLLIALLAAAAITAGCGSPAPDPSSFKTLGDLEKASSFGYSYSDDKFAGVVTIDGKYYQVKADIPEDVSSQLGALDWEDPDHDKKQSELLAPIEIKEMTDLSDQILPQEKLDEWVGKTGEDLLNDEWVSSGYFNDDNSMSMEYGPFQYKVTFDGEVDAADDSDPTEILKPLKVKSIEFLAPASSLTSIDPE